MSSTTRSRSAPSSKTAQPLGAREPGGPGGTAGGTTRGDTVSLCTEDRDLGLAEDTSHGTRTAYTTATVGVLLDQLPVPFPSPRVSQEKTAPREPRPTRAGHSPGSPTFLRSPISPPPVPTPESTDTLLLRLPPPAHAHPSGGPDQTPPPPRARASRDAARRVREEEEMKPKSLPFIAFEHKRCVPSFPRPRSRRAVAASSAARR